MKCVALGCGFDAEPPTAWCVFHTVEVGWSSPTTREQGGNNRSNTDKKEHTEMSDYVLIVVDNGTGNGETLVRIWPTGQVDADYRPKANTGGWTPVSLLGGGLRCEGDDGIPLAGVALDGGGLESVDPDAANDKWGHDPTQRGSATREVLGWTLAYITFFVIAIAGPAGNGWIKW